MKVQHKAALKSYKASGFIGKYQRLVKNEVIPYQYKVLWDKTGDKDTEKSHVIANFINAGKAVRGEDVGDGFYGMVFQDSDAAKWLEAVAYSLVTYPDKELEAQADELIDIIAAAQDGDGYLDTYFTIKDKEKRWTNLHEAHELYCAGHMLEAAVAYYQATGKKHLLGVMEKNIDHIYKHFIEEGHEGFPGHPEIELALLKMHRVTGNKKALELARAFIDRRGTDEFYVKERDRRDWVVWGGDPHDTFYSQCDRPVRELEKATGHAVRAVYLFTAMADLASVDDDKPLETAAKRLWKNITEQRMYITGGIGSSVHGEAFTVDYDLPPDTAYCETCASLGLMFFASRLSELECDSSYADIMERAFYNTALAGMQLDGKRFFYVNALESLPGISGRSPTHRHTLPERPKWYACACCPPNLARVIMDFGEYAFGENDDTAFIHLYAAGSVDLENGISFDIDTDYPYSTDIDINVRTGGRIALRIPSWSKTFTLYLNDTATDAVPEKGYVYINVSDGDKIRLSLDSAPRFNFPAARIPSVAGMTALSKGPLVYCFEGADNDGDVVSLRLDTASKITTGRNEQLDTDTLTVNAVRELPRNDLYSFDAPEYKNVKATAIPYYAWCNRGENQMRVFMNKK